MAVWDELKVMLARLRDEQPGTLTGYPMPDVDEGRQPLRRREPRICRDLDARAEGSCCPGSPGESFDRAIG